ncbi:MAG: hypothetical protein A3H59_00970 [Candidatus Jacksonbacteria bacterium RIFCSPLOWO2_02_FULL_43_9]|nr:MAG: hypothetical protein UV70_C0007G0006 [Parcubacteria group bacterium GW2011_GWA2_43_13]OGY69993.1 MAG: hypothetical protein A3B94_03420 [Candidatus Jacksonbacteria bacterium RIFCSPHIGHO2_02_FULL_43_10]OGY71070.1 MAG: hypothetical protein A2986_01200 [Candidatus Jacksonbacteria bacterium RIFCSPLOWO2_01_FULL_44_13]OGY73857.1 MAG: hypothetical protein A3H59_00970 [Candidatus Jacksonbacteria bacterium RIFCSPLOWO2_02_FULL_43_9]HAZ16783.1 hypothetical protein [Candidatus Jacksonbacteria bacter
MPKIIFPELSYRITGICFKVHKELGRFCSEMQYADKLEKILLQEKMLYVRECDMRKIEMTAARGNRVDFLIEDSILLDVKAKKFITKEDYIQMLRYLKWGKKKLGVIVNFRHTYLKPKRVINNEFE